MFRQSFTVLHSRWMMDKFQNKKITSVRFWGFGQFAMAAGRVHCWDHVNTAESIQVGNFLSGWVIVFSRITWLDAVFHCFVTVSVVMMHLWLCL